MQIFQHPSRPIRPHDGNGYIIRKIWRACQLFILVEDLIIISILYVANIDKMCPFVICSVNAHLKGDVEIFFGRYIKMPRKQVEARNRMNKGGKFKLGKTIKTLGVAGIVVASASLMVGRVDPGMPVATANANQGGSPVVAGAQVAPFSAEGPVNGTYNGPVGMVITIDDGVITFDGGALGINVSAEFTYVDGELIIGDMITGSLEGFNLTFTYKDGVITVSGTAGETSIGEHDFNFNETTTPDTTTPDTTTPDTTTPDTTTPDTTTPDEDDDSGLSGGAIAGIVIGSVAVVGGGAAAAVMIKRRKS